MSNSKHLTHWRIDSKNLLVLSSSVKQSGHRSHSHQGTSLMSSNLKHYWLLVFVLVCLTFRHRASCILGQAFQYSPENAFYTGCNRMNVRDFGRVFLRSNYTDITQNTYIHSLMVMEILARKVWNFDSYYSLIDYQIHIETGRNMWFL